MGNGAIAANPPSYPIDITTHGSDWLWAAFAVMLLSAIVVTGLGFKASTGHRLFHWLSAGILFTASCAYFSMASNLGKTGILVEFYRGKLTSVAADEAYRSIWYARYIDWTITTPLLLLDLLLATGLPSSDIFFAVFLDLLMIVTGLIGALVESSYKWGFYTGGCIAMLFLFGLLVGPARTSAYAMGQDVGGVYLKSAVLLSFLWFLYPIAWGLADGGNVISPDGEMVFYGVLDVLAKPGFIFFHLFSLRNIDYSKFEFTSGHYSVGSRSANSAIKEKDSGVPFTKLRNHEAKGVDHSNVSTNTADIPVAAEPTSATATRV